MSKDKPKGHTGNEAGFSMVEILVVVVIMTILLVASIPSFRSHTDTVNLTKGAAEVASSLKLARMRAVSGNVPVVVEFNTDDGTYLLFEDTNGDGNRGNDETWAGPYETPNRITLNNVNFTDETVTFAPDGAASETGAVVLANTRGAAQRVDVTAPTGLVYISDMYQLGEVGERD